jgi:1-aminocyclopropane-1-carboxylate deaminase/D-cysteine desulfhydrase-like pyridoxal-dependent ACC family enzyme
MFSRITVRGKSVHVKRDDLFRLGNLHGNKARKLKLLSSLDPPPEGFVSYGGFQSNAMGALAGLSQARGCEFLFYLQRAPTERELASSSTSNFKRARECGTKFQVLPPGDYKDAFGSFSSGSQGVVACASGLQSKGLLPVGHTFVPQGAAMPEAEVGFKLLAGEIVTYWEQTKALDLNANNKLLVVLPAGTGTSALFLARYLHSLGAGIEVATVPCVGDADYLHAQMQRLDRDSGGVGWFICVLCP